MQKGLSWETLIDVSYRETSESLIGAPMTIPGISRSQVDPHSLRSSVLETIRSRVDITTLFRPELKIDIPAFIQDQMVFRKMAARLRPLAISSVADVHHVKEALNQEDVVAELNDRCREGQCYQDSMDQLFVDELHSPSCATGLAASLAARISTIYVALVAQNTPERIQQSQESRNEESRSVEEIKRVGSLFLRESLRFHLDMLSGREGVSFPEQLLSSARQLTPFVRKVTTISLLDHGHDFQEDPLLFRDHTGNNYHGLVAATVMGCSLKALGFDAQIMTRCDLEPTVSAAAMHSIVRVTSPHRTDYTVDCAYLQFHKDLYDAPAPSDPILLLESTRVDEYIEAHLMSRWRENSQRLAEEGETFRSSLNEKDRLLPYVLPRERLLKRGFSDPESWVKNALRKVWDSSTYSPSHAHAGVQEIFFGVHNQSFDGHEYSRAYEYCKYLNIAPLTSFLSVEQVEKRLEQLLHQERLIGRNFPEAIALIGQLPFSKRDRFHDLLEIDPRLSGCVSGGLHLLLNAYLLSLKKMVNPDGLPLKVVYGCSGNDCMTVLLATDAAEVFFVDLTPTTYDRFQEALQQRIGGAPLPSEITVYQSLKNFYGGGLSHYNTDGTHKMVELESKFFADLAAMGVPLDQVEIKNIDGEPSIGFPWQYPGYPGSKRRYIRFIHSDITRPSEYVPSLRNLLREGIDIFYMKASFLAPLSYPTFLPEIAQAVREGGWLMTSDKTFCMDLCNPDQCLSGSGQRYSLRKNHEITLFEEYMVFESYPFFRVLMLEIPERYRRRPSNDLSYWVTLNLRQKISSL